MNICTRFPIVDEVIERFGSALGRDQRAYHNHVRRIVNYYQCLAGVEDECLQQVLIAAAFHDLGIWTARSFDYLAPSVRLAQEYLSGAGLVHLSREVEAIIVWHHKLSRHHGEFASTVERFRRADLVDVSLGVIRFGVPRPFVRAVKRAFPNAGFHWRLVELTGRQLLRDPLRPLPMVRW
jgi:hypothetical protein